MKPLLFIFLILCAGASCSRKARTGKASPASEKVAAGRNYGGEGFQKGTVKDLTGKLDGCTFILEIGDTAEKRIEPLNLADSLRSDGLKVWVKYAVNTRAMSICMVGEIVTITAIERR